MLTVQSFFDLADFPHRDFLEPGAHVWQPLNELKNYMENCLYPFLDRALLGDGIPLTGHVILHDGKAFPATNAQIVFGDATKGKLDRKSVV